ncbi:MAG: hypothetical protein JWR09_3778 [Mucilaginibacter sp.]|nr:hypothetical protein [Mucilaginibacter sp.]
MKKKILFGKLIILFIPWILALAFQSTPVGSYWIAWLGSFFIFFVTLTGKIIPMPDDRAFSEQLMRPIFIVQIIFAGYMCCTSIFYFISLLGYRYFTLTNPFFFADDFALQTVAQCQRYYVLGHAAFASGIICFMKYPVKSKYYIANDKLANNLLIIALITFPVSLFFLKLPGLAQFYFQYSSLSFISGTLALAFAIPLQKLTNTLICLALYGFNFYAALTSGFKEPIIISVLILGIFLYPNYKKIVITVFVPALLLLFTFLPTYVNSFRAQAWSGDETFDAASQIALDAALNNDSKDDTNWGFLVYRFSEIGMFTDFVRSTPEKVDFYKLQLVEQSAITIVPRVFWPSKPSTEELIMERVYDAGVVSTVSNVSAKPAFIVDAYLSYGSIGIIIFLFIYGAVAQLISIKAEKLFGGYIFGTALIFSGLFQIFWRGLSFEFLVNSVFWSYFSMLAIFKILRYTNILKLRA